MRDIVCEILGSDFLAFPIILWSLQVTIVISYSVVITIILWKRGGGFSHTGTLECLDIFKLHKIRSNITVKNVSFIKKLQPTAGEYRGLLRTPQHLI